MLELPCPHCGARLQLPEAQAGHPARCPVCGAMVSTQRRGTSDAITAEPVPPGAPRPTAITTPDQVLPAYPAGSSPDVSAASGGWKSCLVPTLLASGFIVAGVAFLFPACLNVQEAARRGQTISFMKQIGFACHAYHDGHKHFPPPMMVPGKGGEPVALSWRVAILPFIGEQPLFKRFDQTAGWDNPRNQRLVEAMPMQYFRPGRDADAGATYFQYFTGPDTVWTANGEVKFGRDIHWDNFLFAEAAEAVPWTKPADMAVRPGEALPLPEGTFLVCMADASIRHIDRRRVSDEVLRWYLRPNDGPAPPLE